MNTDTGAESATRHSPLPWGIYPALAEPPAKDGLILYYEISSQSLEKRRAQWIAKVLFAPTIGSEEADAAEDRANARLIVTAVNNYGALLGLVERLVKADADAWSDPKLGFDASVLADEARDLIKKIKEGE